MLFTISMSTTHILNSVAQPKNAFSLQIWHYLCQGVVSLTFGSRPSVSTCSLAPCVSTPLLTSLFIYCVSFPLFIVTLSGLLMSRSKFPCSGFVMPQFRVLCPQHLVFEFSLFSSCQFCLTVFLPFVLYVSPALLSDSLFVKNFCFHASAVVDLDSLGGQKEVFQQK